MKSKLLKSLLLLMVLAISIQLQAQTESPRKALSFDGVNDYVSGTTGISTALTAITIEAWVYHNTLPAGVVQRYVTIQPEVAVLRYDGSASGGTNELHFYIKNSAGSIVSLRVDNVLTTGTWMHIAGTYDGTNMKLYLNGSLMGSASPAGGLYAPTGAFSFSANGSEAFNGKMDEVSVWNYARAEADIREDMYRAAPIANANLKNYWQFNNGSGTTLTDLKGTATGTLNNMTNANWIASTIPFAAGAVNTSTVMNLGPFSFTGTGFEADFVTLIDFETIVACRIDTLPNTSPTGVSTVFNSQYWVVKQFGTTTFTANLTFTLSEDLTATDQSSPSTILLYARSDNSDASWTLLTTATSVNAANNTATFNGITGFSQFMVARECVNPTNGGTIAGDQTGCNPFDPAAFTSTALPTGQSGTLEYKWQQSTTSSSAGFSDIAGSDAATYDAGSLTQTTWYKRLARVSCKTDWTGAVESNVLQISFYPSTAISSQSTAGQAQPLNGTFTAITVTATGNNLTYQWYSNASAINSGGTSLEANNGAQTNSYTPQVTTAGTLYYYCIVSDQCGTTATSAVSGAFIVDPITSTAPAGSGTAGDPYRIANLNNLYYLSTTPGLWNQGYTFIQTANINAAETRNWDGGQGFIPIGNQSVEFKGHYHGKGNSIDSLYINRPGSHCVGFFGQISQTPSGVKSTIDSLGLTNVNITGQGSVGGLGGYAAGFNISHCSVIGGSVTATNSGYSSGVGGMFGYTPGYTADNHSTSHCFAAVTVSGQGEVGGFVGQTYGGYINQCYSSGLVSGTGEYVGGFVGYRMSVGNVYTLDSSYYDIQASGQATGTGRNDQPAYNHLQGKTTAEMKTQATYDGWDFSTVWKISGSVNNGYPYFDYPNTQISTATVSNIANNTATATGSINHIGALPITAHGFCWNTTGTPTLTDAKVNLGATTTSADYSASINSFSHNTSYYLRAYAIDANDTIYGNVVNFTTTNTPTGGTCMRITAYTRRIRIPDNNTLDLTNNYSIEAWINPDSYPTTGDRMLIRKGIFSGSIVSGYYLERTKTGNSLGLVFDDMVTADNILTVGMWHHIAAVNDNGTRHIYVNGVEYPLTGTPKTVIANSDPLIIGNGNNGGNLSQFYGKFDEISLWNTALSQSQIREHMHFPLAGTETGLVSYWQFDEKSGATVSDKMGINNGIIVTGGYSYEDVYEIEPNPNPYWLVSTIPFGMGYSNTQVVTATGTNTFTNTGLAMNFTAKTGMDSIVVARIDSFPNINPTGLNAVFERQYWAIHKYGTGTLTANLTFTISEGLNTIDENNPSNIKLYTRSSMADDSSWVLLASATSVNAASNAATFNGITGFSQFIIGKESPTASWVGNNSTAWSVSSNWSDGAVPTATSDINIPSGTTFSPMVNLAQATPAICNNFTIQAGAVLTVAAGKALTVNGALTNNAGTGGLIIEAGGSMIHNSDNVNGTVKTYLTGEPFPADPDPCTMYHLVSVPLNPSNNSISGLFSGGYLYGHVPADNSWVSLGTSTTNDLNEQNGFLVYYTANSTLSFAGPLNNGTFSPVVTYPGLPDNNNFALVPNPYPSKIDWNASGGWTKTNIGASIWIFNDGNYGVWNGTSGTHGATQYIAPGQAFFVQTTAASPVLTMTNSVRTHQTATFFKNGNTVENQLRVLASGNGTADELLIGFKPDCSDIYNPQEDALKIYGSTGVPQIFTLAGDTPLTINNLAQPNGPKTVAMSFECEKAGEYSLSFSQIETFAAGTQITLIDELTNQTINLSNQTVYSFIHTPENAANRFKLVFGGTIGINEPTANACKMWIAGNTLFISTTELAGQQAVIEVYNASGHRLLANTLVLDELTTLELTVKGFVIVKLTSGKEIMTVKGILK